MDALLRFRDDTATMQPLQPLKGEVDNLVCPSESRWTRKRCLSADEMEFSKLRRAQMAPSPAHYYASRQKSEARLMALSHEILWREMRGNSPIPFDSDFINLGNWNLPLPFLENYSRVSLSLSLFLPFINPSGWLALARRPLVGISSVFAPFFGDGRTTA